MQENVAMVKAEMEQVLGMGYELGLSEAELRAIFERELANLKSTEQWEGESSDAHRTGAGRQPNG